MVPGSSIHGTFQLASFPNVSDREIRSGSTQRVRLVKYILYKCISVYIYIYTYLYSLIYMFIIFIMFIYYLYAKILSIIHLY